eukprot:TRINITY_DN5281_c0_g1_i2.p1 TRINITY_DN5281_c0_g1~~TRINITY_DN5281_c0_g1_i2.p1  ORF type:complete len:497 (-),score=161.10 TRINITY_DN5281_c0_g1_i2:202-1692(-)
MTDLLCFKCDCRFSNDDKAKHIQKLEDFLEKAQSLAKRKEDSSSDEASKEERESSHEDATTSLKYQPHPDHYEKKDRLASFIKRMQMLAAAKAFNKWKEVVDEAKSKKEDPTSEANDEVTDCPKDEQEIPEKQSPQIESRKRLNESTDSLTPSIRTVLRNAQTKTPRANRTTLEGTPFVPGHAGLRNLGNTCFMNAVLQCLSYIPELREFFVETLLPSEDSSVRIQDQKFTRQPTVDIIQYLKKKTVPKFETISIAMQIHVLLRALWSGRCSVVTPYSFLSSIWKFIPSFKGYQQQDAQEFLICLLDRLQLEFCDPMATKKEQMEAETIVTRIFQGAITSMIKCPVCKATSKREEKFQEIALDLPEISVARRSRRTKAQKEDQKKCTLDECLEKFTETENIEGWTCSECHTKSDTTRHVSISQIPKVLCIVLKRFVWTSNSKAKVDTIVNFPMRRFDMSSYMSASSTTTDCTYHLRSIIVHHGSRFNSKIQLENST